MNILGYPLGLIMRLLYNILHSYGWSLILFTLLVRLVLVPLSIKQQKSSAKMGCHPAADAGDPEDVRQKPDKDERGAAEALPA